ncbi:MAG TPA: hypothetical protein VK897_16655 [Anaerolineales bacterium]|nr:hypothetical protein [Anaerolineales bacterium]
MNIAFQKRPGNSSLDVAFFWKMEIHTKSPATITDHFIPELFFDYFFIKEGKIKYVDEARGTRSTLPRQMLKTIHTGPLAFVLSTPLVLYGARLSLRFAESFWGEIPANCFLRQAWAGKGAEDLEEFQSQVVEYLQSHRVKKSPYQMFSSDLQESAWLVNFSARHKRRLYKTTFGLSKKEMQNIRNLHSFLDQACDFASENPRIIQHVNPDVFYDQPHLNHTFRKMTGFSPVEYFQANSILQDHLMSASYNEISTNTGTL